MQATSLPVSAGWSWIMQGMALFRQQPLAMFTWALTLGFVVLLATLIAPIGPLLFVAAMPAFTAMTLEAGARIERGERLVPLQLFSVLSRPGLAKRLFAAGLAYMGTILVAGLLSFMPFAAELQQALQSVNRDDAGALLDALRTPLVVFGICYVCVSALFWHVPALIAWHGLSLRKAMFFSAVACWRNKGAFVLYGAAWAACALGLEVLAGLLEQVGVSAGIAGLLQMPLNFAAAAILYGSFFPIYRDIFGEPPMRAGLSRG